MRTDKVQSIVGSMRDTMSIALQLHQEARLVAHTPTAVHNSSQQMARKVTLQDVELHRRLLQQLYKDSVAFHDVFFKLTPSQKMNLISVDRQLKMQRRERRWSENDATIHATNEETYSSVKRLSAVTRAKIEQKKQIQQLLIENNFSPKPKSKARRSLSKSADARTTSSRVKIERKTKSFGSSSGSWRGLDGLTSSVSGGSPHFRSSPRPLLSSNSARRPTSSGSSRKLKRGSGGGSMSGGLGKRSLFLHQSTKPWK